MTGFDTAGLVQTIYSGIVLGSIYAIMAMGLTLIYGGLRMLNLAHGALFTVGGYVAWVVATSFGVHPLVGMAIAFVVVAALGILMQVSVIKPMIGREGDWASSTIIATVGVSIILENLMLAIFNPRAKNPPTLFEGSFSIVGGVVVTYQSVALAGIAIISLVGMGLFLTRSRHGLAVRAVSQGLEPAHLMGINIDRIYIAVMGLSAGLAAISGVLLAAIYFLTPTVGWTALMKAFIVTIFGGLGSIRGTIQAAYLVGLLESLVSFYWGAKWSLPVLFAMMIVVLVIRPGGLSGVAEEVRL